MLATLFIKPLKALPLMLLLLGFSFQSSAQDYDSAYDDQAYDSQDQGGVYDPYEDINRAVYGFNSAVDRYFLVPVVQSYRFIVPSVMQQGISNMLDNIELPVTFFNSIFQGDAEYAGTSFWRFTINSTLGFAGFMDVASAAGMEKREEDFGQTLGVYGVDTGPYIMLPLLGPSNVRDAGGRIVDIFTNPLLYDVNDEILIAHRVIDVIDSRHRTLDITIDLERSSLDPYAALRSLYMQNREDRVRNGQPKTPPL